MSSPCNPLAQPPSPLWLLLLLFSAAPRRTTPIRRAAASCKVLLHLLLMNQRLLLLLHAGHCERCEAARQMLFLQVICWPGARCRLHLSAVILRF
jgi:hypothetical protein